MSVVHYKLYVLSTPRSLRTIILKNISIIVSISRQFILLLLFTTGMILLNAWNHKVGEIENFNLVCHVFC